MNRRKEFTIKCIVTGNDETYEVLEIRTQPSGKGGQVHSFFQKPSCLNYKCAYRDKADCPLQQ